MPTVTVSTYDCVTSTVTGSISNTPPFPDSVCAYAYCSPANSVPECPPTQLAKCVPWSNAQTGGPGSSTFQISGVPKEGGCTTFEVVVWAEWCDHGSLIKNCGTTTTTTTTTTTSTTTTSSFSGMSAATRSTRRAR